MEGAWCCCDGLIDTVGFVARSTDCWDVDISVGYEIVDVDLFRRSSIDAVRNEYI